MDINNFSYTGPGFLNESPRAKAPRVIDRRVEALRLAYSIPGYKETSIETKNYIYDAIIRAMKGVKTA